MMTLLPNLRRICAIAVTVCVFVLIWLSRPALAYEEMFVITDTNVVTEFVSIPNVHISSEHITNYTPPVQSFAPLRDSFDMAEMEFLADRLCAREVRNAPDRGAVPERKMGLCEVQLLSADSLIIISERSSDGMMINYPDVSGIDIELGDILFDTYAILPDSFSVDFSYTQTIPTDGEPLSVSTHHMTVKLTMNYGSTFLKIGLSMVGLCLFALRVHHCRN